MFRKMLLLAFSLVFCVAACYAAPKPNEITDPEQAKADPDFAIQGEYLGEKIGAQVIALGDGKFDAVVYQGGLPGAGWCPKDKALKKSTLSGERKGDATKLSGQDATASIEGQKLTLVDKKSGEKTELKRTVRKSPTLGAKPPAGAVVLFAGPSDVDKWQPGKIAPDGTLDAEANSKQKFGDHRAHIEFRLSYMPNARGQGRSNSGVYIHSCYEMQVLDSFGLKGENNECGGFYSIKAPDVNMCFPPLEWQTYDIDFTAPKYEGEKKVANGRITVKHNGVVIHDNLELPKGTPGRQPEGPSPRSLYFQGHGNHVHFQNIWMEEKK
jgi:hypothetical protein